MFRAFLPDKRSKVGYLVQCDLQLKPETENAVFRVFFSQIIMGIIKELDLMNVKI